MLIMCLENKQQIYNILIANSINKIEYVLSKLFPYLNLHNELDKFGRCRQRNATYGREYKYYGNINFYTPYKHMLESDFYDYHITPLFGKYKNYEDYVKNICTNYKTNTPNDPTFNLLYPKKSLYYQMSYNHINLSAFYYEMDDKLYTELKNANKLSESISTNVNMYRAIYHTHPKFHDLILHNVNLELDRFFTTNITHNKQIICIKKIYWWLSHATLFDRGSCAITEIVCNALLIFVNKSSFFQITNSDIKLDIEAMLLNKPELFYPIFDKHVNFNKLDNINKYEIIHINDFNDILIDPQLHKNTIFLEDVNDIKKFYKKKDSYEFKDLTIEFQ